MADNFNQSNDVQMAVDAALQQEKAKKKKKKRTIILIVIGVLLLIIVVSALSGGSDDSSSNANASSDSQTTASSEVKAEEKEQNKDGKIGDYVCTVKSATKCKDYEGKPAVKITYAFTNNDDEAQSFDLALTDNVYQDGVGLETAITLDNDDIDYGFDVKIKPGVTKDVTKIYLLQNETSDLEVEITELISFSDDKLTETVKLK